MFLVRYSLGTASVDTGDNAVSPSVPHSCFKRDWMKIGVSLHRKRLCFSQLIVEGIAHFGAIIARVKDDAFPLSYLGLGRAYCRQHRCVGMRGFTREFVSRCYPNYNLTNAASRQDFLRVHHNLCTVIFMPWWCAMDAISMESLRQPDCWLRSQLCMCVRACMCFGTLGCAGFVNGTRS